MRVIFVFMMMFLKGDAADEIDRVIFSLTTQSKRIQHIEHVLKPQLEALTANATTSTSSGRSLRSCRGVSASGSPLRVLMLGCGDSQFSSDLHDAADSRPQRLHPLTAA